MSSAVRKQRQTRLRPAASRLVSVILPVYNGEDSILKAVHSVLGQTHRNLELIVVDDGSTDNTPALLTGLSDERLTVLRQSNQGVSAARNRGLSHARGDYIGFIDSDDCWFKTYLAESLRCLDRAGEPRAIVYSAYYGVDEADRLTNLSPVIRLNGRIFERVLTRESVFLPSTTLLHRDIAERLGGFPEDCYHEDRAFFLRACREYPAFATGKRLVAYRQSTEGRCRKVLADYGRALSAELSILTSLQPMLSGPEYERLMHFQLGCLLHRFLMYGYLDFARQLAQQYRIYPSSVAFSGKKGALARLSLGTGINLMQGVRTVVQALTRNLGRFYWGICRKGIATC